MWGPLVVLLQHHEDSVDSQRLEELLSVHPRAVFIQHQGADTRHVERVTDLREREKRFKMTTETKNDQRLKMTTET